MYWTTVTPLLRKVLLEIMNEPIFTPFRLVGGTSLSLQLGHRESADIDLFTDAEYGAIDFESIHEYFTQKYPYSSTNEGIPFALGSSWYVGESKNNAVKIDVYYTDTFIRPILKKENVRMATVEEIVAMKMEVIGYGGRKKDFWDLHELHKIFSIEQMILLKQERNQYTYTNEEMRASLLNFNSADDDFDPVCLLGKQWPLIKLDFIQWLNEP